MLLVLRWLFVPLLPLLIISATQAQWSRGVSATAQRYCSWCMVMSMAGNGVGGGNTPTILTAAAHEHELWISWRKVRIGCFSFWLWLYLCVPTWKWYQDCMRREFKFRKFRLYWHWATCSHVKNPKFEAGFRVQNTTLDSLLISDLAGAFLAGERDWRKYANKAATTSKAKLHQTGANITITNNNYTRIESRI